MLQKAPPISGCLERALSAERRAALTSDAGLKHDYERLARDWRQVATSYEFNVRLERFLVAIDELKAAAIAEDTTASALTPIPRRLTQASRARSR